MLKLYRRFKNEAGKWTAEKIKEGRGIRASGLVGPFFVRPWINGVQKRTPLQANTFAEARQEADELEKLFTAQSHGLTVGELTTMQYSNRIPIKSVVETYLEQKNKKAPKTVAQYRLTLHEFIEGLARVKFLDQINEDVLRGYQRFLEEKGFAGKTIDTRINIVYSMLKKNGVEARIPKDEMPTVETEAAVPYSDDELKKMFDVMNTEETAIYKFFLGSACRDREVTFAAWADIDFVKGTYTVRSKPDVGFTVKNHESRTVPLPNSLMKLLKDRQKSKGNSRWIFATKKGDPGNHFLRKLKKIALRAGTNCGQCKTAITKGEYSSRKKVEVTCKTDPVCEDVYLHRFRKTCATKWMEAGIPVRTIQSYLGHKSLEVTSQYLGVTPIDKVRDKIDRAAGD